jgi:hypothetical protein
MPPTSVRSSAKVSGECNCQDRWYGGWIKISCMTTEFASRLDPKGRKAEAWTCLAHRSVYIWPTNRVNMSWKSEMRGVDVTSSVGIDPRA